MIGWIVLLAITFAASSSQRDDRERDGNPRVITSALTSAAAKAVILISTVGQLFCGVACLTSASRMTFAFSRDGAVPGHNLWRRLGKNKTPTWSVFFVCMCALIITIPAYFPGKSGYPVAFFAVTTLSAVGLYIAYTCRCSCAGGWATSSSPGRGRLAAKYRWINADRVVWVALCMIIFCLPFTPAARLLQQQLQLVGRSTTPRLVMIVVIGCGDDLVADLGAQDVQGPDPDDRPRRRRQRDQRRAWSPAASPERRTVRLEGKVCVITGAAGGIGAATASVFEREGARVVGVDLLEHSIGELSLQADVTDEESVAATYLRIRDELGRIDVLFNNAGISPPEDASVLDTELEVYERVQATNLRSVFLCCKHGIPHLLETGGGSVINTASFVAVMGAATSQIAYTASKGGVLAMSRELGVEFAKQGVRVNALCPGPVETPLLLELFAADPERAARRLVHVPMGRFGKAEEIANAVLFLASDESSFVNAATFVVDGGISGAYTTPL